jgi:hypothetical protein
MGSAKNAPQLGQMAAHGGLAHLHTPCCCRHAFFFHQHMQIPQQIEVVLSHPFIFRRHLADRLALMVPESGIVFCLK